MKSNFASERASSAHKFFQVEIGLSGVFSCTAGCMVLWYKYHKLSHLAETVKRCLTNHLVKV